MRHDPGRPIVLEILRNLGRRIWANRLAIELAALMVLTAIALARYAGILFD